MQQPAKWGQQGAPLLPKSLRLKWGSEALPDWFADELGLPSGATYGALGTDVRIPPSGLSARARKLLSFVIASRRDQMREVHVFDAPLPEGFVWDTVPWEARTINAIKNAMWRHQIPWGLQELQLLQFADLERVPHLGPIGLLDFACTLEAAVSTHSRRQQSAATASETTPDSAQTESDEIAKMHAELAELSQEDWPAQVSGADPRFRNMLPRTRTTVLERIDAAIATVAESDAHSLRALLAESRAVKDRAEDLRNEKLEVALEALVTAITGYTGERNAALLDRLQWSGAATDIVLEEAAARLSITRERMRQLQVKVDNALLLFGPHPVYLPALDRALRLLESAAPINADAAARLVASNGIAGTSFRPESVLAAAKRLGHAHTLAVTHVSGANVIVAQPHEAAFGKLVSIARGQISAAGATSFRAVAEAAERDGHPVAEEAVRDILLSVDEFKAIADDWLIWPDQPQDYVSKYSRRMLSIVAELDIGALRDGLSRAFRFRALSHRRRNWPPLPPPRAVLVEYYRGHAEFVIDANERVRSVEPLSAETELAPAERILAEVLRSAPLGVMDRISIATECERRGVPANTTWMMCSYDPIMDRLGHNLWCLRGTRVDPASVSELLRQNAERPKERRTLDHGWTDTGELWFALRLPKHFEAQTLFVPSAISRYVEGRTFQLDESGRRISVSAHGALAGHREPARAVGADEGDVLIITFDLVGGRSKIDFDAPERLEDGGAGSVLGSVDK